MKRTKVRRSTCFWSVILGLTLCLASWVGASDNEISAEMHWNLVKGLLISDTDQQANTWDVPYHEPVLTLLREGDPTIRAFAAYALGEVKCHQAVDDLIVLLGSDDMHLRHIAARALGKIGDSKAVMPLIEVLCRQDEADMVQSVAAQALGRLGDARARRILIHLTMTEDGMLRNKAVTALNRLNMQTERKLASN